MESDEELTVWGGKMGSRDGRWWEKEKVREKKSIGEVFVGLAELSLVILAKFTTYFITKKSILTCISMLLS